MVLSVCPLCKEKWKTIESFKHKCNLIRVRFVKHCSGSNIEKDKKERAERRLGVINGS